MTARTDGIIIPLDAYNLVSDGIAEQRELMATWMTQAEYNFADLSNYTLEPINYTVDYNIEPFAPSFVRPVKPASPALAPVVTNVPDLPDLDPIALQLLGDAPAEPDFGDLVYIAPTPPSAIAPSAPSDVTPVLDAIVVADMDPYQIPEVPDLYALDLPDVPTINLPTFDGVRPTIAIDLPQDGQLDFTEQAYVSALQAQIQSQLGSMLQGNYGLPLAIEQALFDRGRVREDRLVRQQLMQIDEDMAARGLSEPNGIFAARRQQALTDAHEKKSALNRELTIERAKEALEGVKFAATQGIAYEQVLIQQNQAINERALKVAMYVRDYEINRINAMIGIANLEVQLFQTDAQVWRQRIDGALATLEIYKAQIEGQRVVGEINKTLVDRYEAQHRALSILVDIYKSNVEAAKTKGEINVQRIEAAKLKLEQYDTEVNAWSKLQDTYRTQVDVSMGPARFAEIAANIHATRINAYRTKGEAIFREGDLQIQKNAQTLARFASAIERERLNQQGQLAQLDAVLRRFGAETSLYEADGNIAQAESAALDRAVSLKIENERNRTSVAIEQGKMLIDQMLKIGELLLEQLKAKAANISQLLSSAQSGFNYGANFGGNSGNNFSQSGSVSWSGEAPDYTGPTSF